MLVAKRVNVGATLWCQPISNNSERPTMKLASLILTFTMLSAIAQAGTTYTCFQTHGRNNAPVTVELILTSADAFQGASAIVNYCNSNGECEGFHGMILEKNYMKRDGSINISNIFLQGHFDGALDNMSIQMTKSTVKIAKIGSTEPASPIVPCPKK
jgi:hypothetical protein